MKVLKKGRPQKGWSIEAACSGKGNGAGGCSAKLLVEQGDLFTTSNTDMGGDTETFVTFKCPECGVLSDLNQKEWPPHNIRDGLPTRRQWDQGDYRG